MIWASADVDHFRFTSVGNSANSVTGRDVVNDFDATEDVFVFDHIFGATSLNWIETNVGGSATKVVLVDLNGDASYEMAIQLHNLTGILTSANFILPERARRRSERRKARRKPGLSLARSRLGPRGTPAHPRACA